MEKEREHWNVLFLPDGNVAYWTKLRVTSVVLPVFAYCFIEQWHVFPGMWLTRECGFQAEKTSSALLMASLHEKQVMYNFNKNCIDLLFALCGQGVECRGFISVDVACLYGEHLPHTLTHSVFLLLSSTKPNIKSEHFLGQKSLSILLSF